MGMGRLVLLVVSVLLMLCTCTVYAISTIVKVYTGNYWITYRLAIPLEQFDCVNYAKAGQICIVDVLLPEVANVQTVKNIAVLVGGLPGLSASWHNFALYAKLDKAPDCLTIQLLGMKKVTICPGEEKKLTEGSIGGLNFINIVEGISFTKAGTYELGFKLCDLNTGECTPYLKYVITYDPSRKYTRYIFDIFSNIYVTWPTLINYSIVKIHYSTITIVVYTEWLNDTFICVKSPCVLKFTAYQTGARIGKIVNSTFSSGLRLEVENVKLYLENTPLNVPISCTSATLETMWKLNNITLSLISTACSYIRDMAYMRENATAIVHVHVEASTEDLSYATPWCEYVKNRPTTYINLDGNYIIATCVGTLHIAYGNHTIAITHGTEIDNVKVFTSADKILDIYSTSNRIVTLLQTHRSPTWARVEAPEIPNVYKVLVNGKELAKVDAEKFRTCIDCYYVTGNVLELKTSSLGMLNVTIASTGAPIQLLTLPTFLLYIIAGIVLAAAVVAIVAFARARAKARARKKRQAKSSRI